MTYQVASWCRKKTEHYRARAVERKAEERSCQRGRTAWIVTKSWRPAMAATECCLSGTLARLDGGTRRLRRDAGKLAGRIARRSAVGRPNSMPRDQHYTDSPSTSGTRYDADPKPRSHKVTYPGGSELPIGKKLVDGPECSPDYGGYRETKGQSHSIARTIQTANVFALRRSDEDQNDFSDDVHANGRRSRL
jgi:hypothetical protein